MSTTDSQLFCGAGKSADGAHDLICYFRAESHTFNIVKDHNFGSLWTLYTDEDNHIAVVADIGNDKMLFRVTSGGQLHTLELSDVKYWRCYPVVVCIAKTGDSQIEVTARVVGDFKSDSIGYAPTVSSSTKIQFGSPDMTRVTALDVADVNIETSSGMIEADRKAFMGEAALLTLLSASYTPGSGEGDLSLVTLQFSRPVNPIGYIAETVTVIDRQFNQQSYQSTGAYTWIDALTVQFELTNLDYTPGSGVYLTVWEGNGIVAADDGESFSGVSNLPLPFP